VTTPSVATGVPLAPLTTLRLGGPAARVVEAHTNEDLVAAIRACDEAGEPVLVLAGGSNVVIADEGFAGTVVRVMTHGVERDGTALTVAAGEPWDDVVAATVDDGLAGIECLSGIPGSTGATPIQNVGAYGQDVAQTVTRVRVYDRGAHAAQGGGSDAVVEDLPAEALGFAYRTSALRYQDRRVVLEVTFELTNSDLSGPLRYAELARAVGADRAPLHDVRAAVLELRRGKGMVLDPNDPDSVSAGSFFTNPILEADEFAALVQRAGTEPPRFPEPHGRVKTSAAWLIERAGFHKGDTRGAVGISTKHSLALINRGGATTAELVAFAREIAAGVRERFGVDLHPEPIFVGHDFG
jgi:UDP-N-acetylmuramate dehydrogenase